MAEQIFTAKTLVRLFNNECDLMPFNALKSLIHKVLKQQKVDLSNENQEINAVTCLNALRQYFQNKSLQKEFISQDTYELAEETYETFINKSKKIPTRNNWHDFFNGMIWLQFPKTKEYFNQQHALEINNLQAQNFDADTLNRRKTKTRSAVRDRLTHFDECGLVLFTDQTWLEGALDKHDWQQIFVKNKAYWHANIQPKIFGHALWEMLLNPFIGLTAKTTVVCISSKKLQKLNQTSMDTTSRNIPTNLDELLLTHLTSKNLVLQRRPWKPMPLLGIPGWSKTQQNEAFYSNTAYFMPKINK